MASCVTIVAGLTGLAPPAAGTSYLMFIIAKYSFKEDEDRSLLYGNISCAVVLSY
jgi:hypothetical protein